MGLLFSDCHFVPSFFSLFLMRVFNSLWFQDIGSKAFFFFSFWDSKVKWKQSSLLGSFPGVPLSWNESRSLCSLFVSMCYVFGIPLRPHLPSHIQITPWSSFWLLLPLSLSHPHFVGDYKLPPCTVSVLSTTWNLSTCDRCAPFGGWEPIDHMHFSSVKWNLWCFFLCHLIPVFKFWPKVLATAKQLDTSVS